MNLRRQAPRRSRSDSWGSILLNFVASGIIVVPIALVLWAGLAVFDGYWSVYFILLGALLLVRMFLIEIRSDR